MVFIFPKMLQHVDLSLPVMPGVYTVLLIIVGMVVPILGCVVWVCHILTLWASAGVSGWRTWRDCVVQVFSTVLCNDFVGAPSIFDIEVQISCFCYMFSFSVEATKFYLIVEESIRNSIHFVQSVLVVYWSKVIFFYNVALQILHLRWGCIWLVDTYYRLYDCSFCYQVKKY